MTKKVVKDRIPLALRRSWRQWTCIYCVVDQLVAALSLDVPLRKTWRRQHQFPTWGVKRWWRLTHEKMVWSILLSLIGKSDLFSPFFVNYERFYKTGNGLNVYLYFSKSGCFSAPSAWSSSWGHSSYTSLYLVWASPPGQGTTCILQSSDM